MERAFDRSRDRARPALLAAACVAAGAVFATWGPGIVISVAGAATAVTGVALLRSLRQRRQRCLLEAAGIAVVRCDETGTILRWSKGAERLFGHPAADVLGHNVRRLMPAHTAAQHDAFLRGFAQRARRESRILGFTRQVVGLRSDGTEFPVLLFVRPGGHPRRQRFDALLQAIPASASNQQATLPDEVVPQIAWRWLRNLGHEIRTPITGIQCHAELLADPATTPERREESVQAILRNCDHLIALIADLLDHARMAAGQLQPRLEPFDPRELAAAALSIVQPHARKKDLELAVQIDTEVPARFVSDPLRLRQILVNLLANAVKFTASGWVRLEVSTCGAGLQFDVCDTGSGIAAAFAPALFQPFQQERTMPHGVGSGLGLSISRQLARLLGGDVVLVDSVPGVGSRFRATVQPPDAQGAIERAGARPAAREHADPAKPLDGVRILLVDDAADVRLAVRRFLESAGAEVEDHGDPLAALQAVGRIPVEHDLALLDLMMPGLSGCELARRLREHGFAAPMLALTADTGADLEQRCALAGFARALPKPIRRARLIEAVGAALQRSPVTAAGR